MERKALGRGIGALLGERSEEKQEKIVLVSSASIKPNPYQPREDFDSENLQELTNSIKEKGIIQPLLVRRKGDQFELIAGERRLRACNSLGIKEIPVIVKDVADRDSLEMALIENIQRQNLNAIEEARAYQFLIDKYGISQEQISDILGKARSTVANTLRILRLPKEIQDEIKKGRVSFAHGRALLELADPNQQRKFAQEIIARKLSVKELESLIRVRFPKARKVIKQILGNPFFAVIEEELQHALATKVRICKKKKQGFIQIDFYSDADLERIVQRLKRSAE